jgi:hypothetical protein
MPNNMAVAPMSSSMSGRCTPNPLPMNSKLLRRARGPGVRRTIQQRRLDGGFEVLSEMSGIFIRL